MCSLTLVLLTPMCACVCDSFYRVKILCGKVYKGSIRRRGRGGVTIVLMCGKESTIYILCLPISYIYTIYISFPTYMGGRMPFSLFIEFSWLCIYQDSKTHLEYQKGEVSITPAMAQSTWCPTLQQCPATADVSISPLHAYCSFVFFLVCTPKIVVQ